MNESLRPLILRSTAEYRQWRSAQHGTLGFVPTMGALHAGHLSLAAQARREHANVVLSIFVNPAQFAPTEDLATYPRPMERDLLAIRSAGTVDALFLPSVADLYPSGIDQNVTQQTGAFVEVLGLSHQLEGSIRPTFFRGVATVLAKFLNIVAPDTLYLGQKDIQQAIVVRRMMRDLCFNVTLSVGETLREPDGLAMSSRNIYLDPQHRMRAPCLYRALKTAAQLYTLHGESNCSVLREAMAAVLDREKPLVQVEYLSVADSRDLHELTTISQDQEAVLSAAIRLGATRILDNIILNKSTSA